MKERIEQLRAKLNEVENDVKLLPQDIGATEKINTNIKYAKTEIKRLEEYIGESQLYIEFKFFIIQRRIHKLVMYMSYLIPNAEEEGVSY
jgi:prefoldin subunit 5